MLHYLSSGGGGFGKERPSLRGFTQGGEKKKAAYASERGKREGKGVDLVPSSSGDQKKRRERKAEVLRLNGVKGGEKRREEVKFYIRKEKEKRKNDPGLTCVLKQIRCSFYCTKKGGKKKGVLLQNITGKGGERYHPPDLSNAVSN